MRYYVPDRDEYYDDITDVLEAVRDYDWHREDDEDFEEWVNRRYGSIEINGTEYTTYEIINEFNNDDYTELLDAFCEEKDGEDWDEAENELMNADPGDTITFQGTDIVVAEDEEEEEDEDPSETLEEVRKRIADKRAIEETKAAYDKKDDDDVMALFKEIE